uniref:BED-type domain-containing protein n=1 Tax=Meloidogyne incognita TaxID=6306 RepID=A0A914M3R7_MELIC
MDTQIFSLEDINGSTSNFVEHIVITRDDPNNFNEKNQLNLSEPAHSLLRYFQYSRGEPFGTCRICQKEIRRTQGNTNGMTKHLNKHPNIFEEFSTAKSAMPPSTRMLKNENSTPLKKQKINGQSEKGLDNIINNGNTILSEDFNGIDETIIDLSKPPHSLLRYYQYDRGDPSAICRICQKRISRKKGNTKGTTRHLMLHPSFFKQFAIAKNVEIPVFKTKREINSPKTSTNQNKISKFAKIKIERWEQNNIKSKKMDDAILRFICLSSQSLSITEQESFTDMFSLACPNYTVKNREYMTNLITKKFQSKYSGLKDALRKCQSCSFTTAIGHSKGQYFLSVTCHYIDDSFNRCWKVLAAEPITGENTSNAITNKINEIFVDLGISPTKVHLFLRDAASSMCRSVEDLKFQYFDCFLHKLALSVSDGSNLPEISKQIQICRELVAFYNWSSAFQNALSRQQQLVDAPKNPLIGEIPTQWISTLTMARRVIEQQNALLAACLDFQDVTLPNFEFLKKILNILQPFENKTKLLSNRNECISSVLPTYKYLLNCLAENPCDSSEERSFKRTISDGLRCRMDGLIDRSFLILATLLDARYKNQANIFDSDQRIRNKTLLCATILPDLDPEQRQNLQKHAFDGTDAMSEFLTGFNEINSMVQTTTSNVEYSTVSEEVESYLESSIERIGADPLEYWRKAANNNSYPNLRKLAKIFLSAPPSSSESERVVSRLVESEGIRGASSVNGQLAKAQMFLHFNYDN